MSAPINMLGLERALMQDNRSKLIISDFDQTLCHHYEYDAATRNHLPIINPSLAETAADLPLVIATARRANHPALSRIWESGLLPAIMPMIAENGGVVIDRRGHVWWSQVEKSDAADLQQIVEETTHSTILLPQDVSLVTKLGHTIVVAKLTTLDGKIDPSIQTELIAAIQEAVDGTKWQAVDCGSSLTVQPVGTSKTKAVFHLGLFLDRYCMIGLGDSPNDQDILDKADIAISVGSRMAEHADWFVEPDVRAVTQLLRIIGLTATQFSGWQERPIGY